MASSADRQLVVGVFGAGGFGRELLPLARDLVRREDRSGRWASTSLCFIETAPESKSVNGCSVMTEDEYLAASGVTKWFNVAVGDGRTRELLAGRCLARGAVAVDLSAPTYQQYDGNLIGEGAVFCANTIVTSDVVIGRFFQANLFSYVAHDCRIGDFVTFAPGVKCNGNVHIGSYAYVGAGAVLRQGTPAEPLIIGEGAVVGMGAVVTRNVAAGATVVGNPARELKRG